MFIKEEFGEGVDSIEDLIERDMSLSKYLVYFIYWALNSLGQWIISVLLPYEFQKVADMENSDVQDYRILSMDIYIISYIFNSQKIVQAREQLFILLVKDISHTAKVHTIHGETRTK